MKKFICLILSLLILPIIAIAQEIGKDAVVAASNMNIFYLGVSNPIEIAVPGITSDKLKVTITNGTIKRVTKGWEVIPEEQSEVIITVSVDGKKVSDKKFRVKTIPEPVAVFAGKHEGVISKDVALKSDMLEARLPDFGWDLKFVIASFSMIAGDQAESSANNKITDKMKTLMTRLLRGQTITFRDIKSIAPDGKMKELSPIVLKIE
jgi:hypothetical protein